MFPPRIGMYRPGRISYQKLVSLYERFGSGKLEFARPPRFQPALAGRANKHHIHRGKMPGSTNTKDNEPAIDTTAHGIEDSTVETLFAVARTIQVLQHYLSSIQV